MYVTIALFNVISNALTYEDTITTGNIPIYATINNEDTKLKTNIQLQEYPSCATNTR